MRCPAPVQFARPAHRSHGRAMRRWEGSQMLDMGEEVAQPSKFKERHRRTAYAVLADVTKHSLCSKEDWQTPP